MEGQSCRVGFCRICVRRSVTVFFSSARPPISVSSSFFLIFKKAKGLRAQSGHSLHFMLSIRRPPFNLHSSCLGYYLRACSLSLSPSPSPPLSLLHFLLANYPAFSPVDRCRCAFMHPWSQPLPRDGHRLVACALGQHSCLGSCVSRMRVTALVKTALSYWGAWG